jgi:hypothetical protein
MKTEGPLSASRDRFIALLRADVLQCGSSELDFGPAERFKRTRRP